MATPFLSEIRVFSFNFPPKGWAFCNGQLLPINQNQALFSLLGTTYGGNGTTNFALPNLQGKTPIHMGDGYVIGQTGGEQNHTLISPEMPQHTHPAVASSDTANLGVATNNFWANGDQPAYAANPGGQMNPGTVSFMGGGQAHDNMSPYLTLTFCIALQGIFPSRN